jgi:hypothetical protein
MSVQTKRKRGCVWWLLVVLAIMLLCGMPFFVADRMGLIPRLTPTPAPTATVTPTPAPLPTATVTPTPAPPPGIGSTVATWQAAYGQGQEKNGYQIYGDWETLVFPGDLVQHIERTYDPPVPIAQAKQDITSLLPADATLIETYTPEGRPETTVDLYSSPSLAIQLPADAWPGGEPGQFIVLYKDFGEGVAVVIIGTGNNP